MFTASLAGSKNSELDVRCKAVGLERTESSEPCGGDGYHYDADVPDSSAVSFTQEEPQELLAQAEMHQAGLEQEQQALASLEHRLEHVLSLYSTEDPISPGPVAKTLVKIQENVRSLKERNLLVVAAAQAEEEERQQVQEEIGEVEQHMFAILPSLEACSNPCKQQELRKDLSCQKAKLKYIVGGVQSRYAQIPADINRRLQEVQLSLQREEEKLMEKSNPVQKLDRQVVEFASGLEKVKLLLEKKSPTVSQAENVLKHVWDELDAWHSRLMLLENEVQDLAEQHPDQAHLLMDQLTQPLQLYQNAAQKAEQRTTFLSKIPACLQEFEGTMYSATCWLNEAQSWLNASCSFTTSRSLQNHANSLQLVLDDSERLRNNLQDFRPVLDEISAVCDTTTQEERLDQNDQQVQNMQRKIVEPLEQLLQAVVLVEAIEAELKTIEKNIPKVRAILSSMDNSSITLTEHLQNRQVILANVQSMQRTLADMERCKGELHLPQGAEESLLVFSRATLLRQPLEELEQLTQQQTALLENKIREADLGITTVPEEMQQLHRSPQRHLVQDPEETLNASDVQSEDASEIKPLSEVKTAAAVEDITRLIPTRPITPFTGMRAEFIEEEDEDLSLSTAPCQDLVTCNVLKEQSEVSTGQSSLAEDSQQALESSEVPISLTTHEEDDEEQLRWSQLYTQIAQKLTTLTKVKEEHHTLISPEEGGTQDEVCSADTSHPDVNEVLYEALRKVFLCLDALTDLLLTPGDTGEDDPQWRLLQQECVSTELVTLTELLSKVESKTRPALSRDEPEVLCCLTSLQDCLHTVQLVFTSSRSQLAEHLGVTYQHQELSSKQLCILDELELEQSEMFPSIKDAPSLEKLLQVLRSQLAFVQHLFQSEPKALKGQDLVWVQLEVRAKALQQQDLEQEVASQRRIQEWTRWDDNCSRLSRLLDDTEAFIGSGGAEGDDEKLVQQRLDACKQTLVQLDESRAALGLLIDQGKVLQTEPDFAAAVSHTGGALELRWQNAYRRAEREIQRCRDIQDCRVRFQTDFASVSEWLAGANKHLKNWSNLADTSDLDQECVHTHLIKLLDFSTETKAMSVKRASLSMVATRLLHLRDADCPGLRAQLAQLEVDWSQLTSDLSKIQDRLQQRLLAAWPPVKLLSDLEDWLEKLETRLSLEKETFLKAKDAARMAEILQHCQELKEGMTNGQLLLDFLCQPGPRVMAMDVQALRYERTMFAENLGALRLKWLLLQRELESQICEAEQMHHSCADRERRLQHLHSWTEQQKKQMNQRKQPTGQTLARKALLELEAVGGRVREVAAALQELKASRVRVEKDHPCDFSFSGQTESVCRACGDLSQQVTALRPALQQTVEQWGCFERDLREASLHTTRVRCALQQQPLLSLKQAEGHMDLLQLLQEKAGKGEELWQSVDKSYQSLVKSVHGATAEALNDQMEGERIRWKDVVQKLEDEHMKSGETLSLWQEYARLSDRCSLQLQKLWHQWEEQDTQMEQQLQVAAEDLQSSMGDVLASSKPLIGQLEPLAANLIQSQTRLLSRDILLLCQATSGKKKSLQAERQRSQSFYEKCENLSSIQKKLEAESMSKKAQSYVGLQQMLTVHQRLEAEIMTGHQLLQGLLRHAVETMEKETGEKRSELMAQATCAREGWFTSVALVCQRKSLVKEQLSQWRVYHRGLKLLWKLLRDVDPLLPPAGPALCALHQLRSCMDDYQCVKDSLGLYSAVYTQTVEAGRRLCETTTESECHNQLQSELQAVEDAWERTTSLLERRRDLVNTTIRKWSQCQSGISSIMCELDEMKTKLDQSLPEKPPDSKDEKHIQRLASGLRELATMKTDLSQYVAAGDSALLEQQLEQLHSQWEELCMKVSLRRQEIADRLNAWTIFNDKNKEFCDWLTQMENKVCHSGDLSIEEMVDKLKKDCMEEINLFSENKSHLKQLGEQLLLASDEAKQTQVHGSLLEVNQRWHNLFHQIEARVKKLKETLVTVQQLDKNMSNLRSWLSRMEAELSRPITYSVCHHQEIQRRLAEQQELQRDIEKHTEGVASVLSLCDVLLRDEDAACSTEAESDSLQETSRSLDQRWRTICAMALDRRLRIEETWKLWCKFLEDYSRFEDWLKIAERTAANPNSADVLYTVAKEELKKFEVSVEGFQRQVHERLTQLELVNNQYRRLARESRTDRASQLKAMVHEGNRRWDTLHRRVAAILRRLKYFTSQREEFEGTRESMLVWLTELDLQLTNVEHFSESDVHHKIQQLNSFQKEITLNTERIDGLIVFGEGLIQKSSPQDAALIEDELEELHSYCQEVFSRLVRFHQRLSQPPLIKEEPELSGTTFSLESSLELIGRPWLGRSQGSLPATPTHLLTSPLERSGRETPVSVDSLPLEWDHTGDVGGSSSHEDDEEEEEEDGEEDEEERTYFSALSEVEVTESQEEFAEALEAVCASSLASSTSMAVHESPRWRSQADAETQSLQLDSEGHTKAAPALTSTPLKQGYLRLMSQCSGSIEDIKRVSLMLDDEEQPEELGLTGLTASDKQSGVIERWELLRAQSRSDLHAGPPEPQRLTSDLDKITSWLEKLIPELERLQQSDPAASIEDMAARAKELKEMQKMFSRYKSIMLSVNLQAQEAPELQERLAGMNRDWSQVSTGLQQWETSLRRTLMRCQEFHETVHSLLLWLAHADSRRYAVDISHPDTPVRALQQHRRTLTDLQDELQGRQTQQASLQALWSQLQPEEGAEESDEAQEKLHVTGSKLKLLLRQVDRDLSTLQQRLDCKSVSDVQGQSASADPSQDASSSEKDSSTQREKRDSPPPRSFFYRVLRAAFPLHLLLLFLLLLPCLIPLSESEPGCTAANNFARSLHPMLRYTNGPPPT
ncbi:Nesprin-2 KASH domain-containing protein 2 [Collichthys lucidus]|uniref:Nesprin-2 KASH domain-containing protein 2 n=1 Tax=Collichthys lucidus TaxID=240159 RepID=A0A4U5UNK3_COLLU|nr:Nesprin-2 KASH domain-containing protein 2 [Collichthys lucidus]